MSTSITGFSTKLCVELAALDMLRKHDRAAYFSEAVRFFRKKANRCIGLDPNHPDFERSRHVETWWDSQSRNWITQTKDARRCEVEDAVYSGDMLGAATAHAERCSAVAGALVTDPFIVRKAVGLLRRRIGHDHTWLSII